jgi:hypothetical protein
MQMSNSRDDILGKELGKLGELGAKFGEVLSNQSDHFEAVGRAGSLGAQFAAKFLPTETCSEKLLLKIAPEKAIKLGYSVLAKVGELQIEQDKPPYPFLKAVVGSGAFNMNPAVVFLEILDGDSTQSEVTITAAAKEGLIKQHTAAKAAQRVAAALRDLANGA